MPGFNNLDWGDWVYGIASGFMGGGASGATSGLVTSASDPTPNHVLALGTSANLKVMLSTFVVSGILSAFFYLQKNPLPAVITVTTDKTTTIKGPVVMEHSVTETKAKENLDVT